MASAFAMADARVDLIESLRDEAIRARLLRMTDPQISMVELANNPSDDDRIRICAIAILSGFCPGEDQFAVFGGGKQAGKLYIKERGFRTLFSHLGIVPEVRTSHPEFAALGTTGKKIWRVGGSASCEYNGEEYSVEFSGDELLGIPGYDTDNVAGIAAKARRRLLQALWVKVSPILTQDQADDDDPDTVPVSPQTPRIEVAPVSQPVETEPIPFVQQIEEATTARALDATARAIKAANVPADEFEFLKSMVKEARQRISAQEATQ